MDENLPASAGDTGLIPSLGGFHMPRTHQARRQNYRTALLKTTSHHYGSLWAPEPGPCNRRSRCNREPVHSDKQQPLLLQQEKAQAKNKDAEQPYINKDFK